MQPRPPRNRPQATDTWNQSNGHNTSHNSRSNRSQWEQTDQPQCSSSNRHSSYNQRQFSTGGPTNSPKYNGGQRELPFNASNMRSGQTGKTTNKNASTSHDELVYEFTDEEINSCEAAFRDRCSISKVCGVVDLLYLNS